MAASCRALPWSRPPFGRTRYGRSTRLKKVVKLGGCAAADSPRAVSAICLEKQTPRNTKPAYEAGQCPGKTGEYPDLSQDRYSPKI
jgi:hypothetical protein